MAAMDAVGAEPATAYVEYRLKVDRRYLEFLLTADQFVDASGAHVFEQIARRHGIVSIGTDPNFKLAARSKKAPTVRVVGEKGMEAALSRAKTEVEELFDTSKNRVILKIDIPKDLHFYVIGKKGENIKEVMATSGCHVHFPETPKGSRGSGGPQPGRDQVSVSGTPECVEKARHLLRGLLPVTISFDIPETVAPERISMSEEVFALAREYDVTVFFKQRQGLRPLALVKGMRRRSSVVEVAAERLKFVADFPPSHPRLVGYMLCGEGGLPRFTLQVDLPTWIHAAVIGTSGKNIKRIMDITQTTIRFPEATQNSAVFISGAANFAKITHLYLHGLQSLLLSFDLTPTQGAALQAIATQAGVPPEEIVQRAGAGLPVTTSFKVTAEEPGFNVHIRTTEATAASAYKTRVVLLGMLGSFETGTFDPDRPGVNSMVDDPAYMPPDDLTGQCMNRLYGGDAVVVPDTGVAGQQPGVDGVTAAAAPAPALVPPTAGWESPWAVMPPEQQVVDGAGYAPQLLTHVSPAEFATALASMAALAGSPDPPDALPTVQQYNPPTSKDTSSVSPDRDTTATPVSRGSTSEITFNKETPTASPTSRASDTSDATTFAVTEGFHESDDENVPESLNSSMGDIRARSLNLRSASPGEESFVELAQNCKRVEAERVLNLPVSPDRARKPTSYWSGDWLSRSMPEREIRAEKDRKQFEASLATITDNSSPTQPATPPPVADINELAASYSSTGSVSRLDDMPCSPFERAASSDASPLPPAHELSREVAEYWSVDSVSQLLTKLKLPTYISLFEEQEVDLATLLTLNDGDLVEIGVKTFGARKKISLAITEIRRLRLSDGNFLSSFLDLDRGPESPKTALTSFARKEGLHSPRASPPGTPPRAGTIGQPRGSQRSSPR